ncbi:MAG: carbon-nitrogen hydrolase family protein [Chthoniobacterales bacterium]
MKIAVAQIACTVGDVAANLRKIEQCADRAHAQSAEWIVFPEMSDTGYVMSVIREHASRWSEGPVPRLQETARRLSLGIVCGISERTDDHRLFNTQIVIEPNGAIAGRYRKTHLFSPAPIEEDKCFASGAETVCVPGGEFLFGLGICYDLRFPEFHRKLACHHGANLLVISSAWPFPRVEHLRILTTARAIENQSYVVLANRVGTDNGVTFCGTSAIIDPAGVVLAAASTDREELLIADISQEALRVVRERMRVFEHRREELY